MNDVPHPDPFLTVRFEELSLAHLPIGWCAGFEDGEWRDKQLAEHLIEWLPEFALKYSEWEGMRHHNAIRLFAKAARSIYTSSKYKSRGEFGEVLLHAMIRQKFKTIPAISKYFYKDASNDTIKGFDAVHVVADGNDLELWLGEAKFYDSLSSAATEIAGELANHTQRDYLRDEFAAITNKIDDASPFAGELKKLLDKNTSLDQVFARTCIPILVTYNSSVVAKHAKLSADYEQEFLEEALASYKALVGKLPALPAELRIQVMLFPLKDKRRLVATMDEVLKKWQDRA